MADEPQMRMRMRIEDAPLRVRREYLLRERRNNRIAIGVVVVIASVLGYLGFRLLA
jgi:hypothetical protein